jgi:uncharacterized protein (TIGR00251 family)
VSKGSDFRTAELPPWLQARAERVVLSLHVQPGARRAAVVGTHGERLKVAVASPPTDGRANAALLEFLADRLDLPKSALELVSGPGSRDKRVAVHSSLTAQDIAARLLRNDRQ